MAGAHATAQLLTALGRAAIIAWTAFIDSKEDRMDILITYCVE
jgi:hypothetical protein